jgi:ferrous iron transport protein A
MKVSFVCEVSMVAARSLAEVEVGEQVVLGAAPQPLDATTLRLLELGLVPGTPVEVTRRGPFGDPLELAVRETRVCLRHDDARRFSVEAAR